MHPDPHAHLAAAGPGARGQHALAVHRRGDRIERAAGEADEEGVALRVDHLAGMVAEHAAHQVGQRGLEAAIGLVAERAQQTRGAFDIREQQRDRLRDAGLGFAA
jgi:hypothetical protein